MFYGFGASPIVVDGTLVLPVDQDTGSYLLGVDAKTGKQRYKVDRPGVISGYSTPTVYQPKGGAEADPDPRVVPAVGLRREGRPPRLVGARARVRDEVGRVDRGGHRVDQRLGLPAEPAGHADPDDFVGRGPEGLRQEQGRQDRRRRSHRRTEPAPRPDAQARTYGFPGVRRATATDSSMPATGPSCARCSPPRTACSRSSSGARAT